MSNKQKIQKSTYGIIQKDSSFKKNDKGHLVVKGYFTSDNRDMAGDIITRDATERAIPMYKQWGNVRYLHTPKPVGKVRRIGVQDGLEWNEAEIEIMDAEAIFQVENELLTALSVGILIDFNDIDFDEDTGGFIINDYTLAEISLVDHPANYDAKLKDIILDDDARQLALQYGLDGLSNRIGGTEMTKKKEEVTLEKDAEITEELETEENLELSEESQVVTEEEVVEEEVSEELVEDEVEEEIVDEIVDEEPEEIEESVEEIEEEIEEEPVVDEVVEEEPVAVAASIDETNDEEQSDKFDDFAKAIQTEIAELKSIFKEFADKQAELGKGSVEEQETEEASEIAKELEAVKESKAELEKRIAELESHIPVQRKGLVAETNIEELEEATEEAEETKSLDLREALKARFLSN